MALREKQWCPISGQPCRSDCAWLDEEYDIDDDGVTREVFCAVAVIAGRCIGDGAEPTETFS